MARRADGRRGAIRAEALSLDAAAAVPQDPDQRTSCPSRTQTSSPTVTVVSVKKFQRT